MTAEKSRDEYMREATQLLNHGDQAAAEGGEISAATKELLLLTRGSSFRAFSVHPALMRFWKPFTSSQTDQWKTHFAPSRRF
jgi:hypothetical protein